MTKPNINIDTATQFLIDTLPENLKDLAQHASESGYLSLMEFNAAAENDELVDDQLDEVLSFFKQDLGLEILESEVPVLERVEEEEDETNSRMKNRNPFDANNDLLEFDDEEYDFYAKQLNNSNIGPVTMVQDSVQSYLKAIGSIQLLSGPGEVAIAQRIEAASRLLVYGLCESPMTIRSMLNWYQQLLNDEIKLRYIINLDVMYSSDADMKSVKELDMVMRAKGVDDIDGLDDEDLEDTLDEESVVDETEELGEDSDDMNRGASGTPISVMEENLLPVVLDLFAQIKKIFTQFEKLQKQRLFDLIESNKSDEALEKKYVKVRAELFELVTKIRLHDDRVNEILEALTARNQLLMGLEGKLLRLALASKVKREDFLEQYQGNELNPNWIKKISKIKSPAWERFVKNHAKDIQKIQSEISAIATETGLPTGEYRKVVELVKKGQTEAARAKREMIEANLRLVIKSAKKYSNRGLGLEFPDLVQDGNIGLMKAVDKFDYRLGYKFSTYATCWIQQGISRSIADQARTIRIPVHMIENINKIKKASRQFLHKHGRTPTAEELAKIVYMPVDKIHKAMKINLKPISLESPVGNEDDSTRMDIIQDDNAIDPFTSAAQKNLRNIVTSILSTLDPKEETVLRQRFGMSTNKTSTLEEVGEYIGVTRERIRQIEQKALNKLKHPSRARKLRSFVED